MENLQHRKEKQEPTELEVTNGFYFLSLHMKALMKMSCACVYDVWYACVCLCVVCVYDVWCACVCVVRVYDVCVMYDVCVCVMDGVCV